MTFASPLWLLGLLPWAAAAIWLLLGRHQRAAVPFIPLWRGPVSSPSAKPSIKRPPLAVLLAILALLLAVLAAGRPMLRSSSGPAITIIVDRGITMSARGAHVERFKETCDRLAPFLLDALGNGPVQMITVPGSESATLDRANWTAAVSAMTPTQQKSRPELDAAIHRCLADGKPSLIVVTDQPVMDDGRLIRIEPETTASNLTIVNIAARASPHAQVMVELRDQHSPTPFRQATVHVESGTDSATQEVQVPRDGKTTTFVDLPSVDTIVSVYVDAPDDLPADNRAWLARENSAAIVDDSPTLPAPLRRMASVYNAHRSGNGKHIAIITNHATAPGEEPTVTLSADSFPLLHTDQLNVEDHPVVAKVNWAVATAGVDGSPPPPDFRPLVTNGADAYVAVHDGVPRRVWVNLSNNDWAQKVDFVIFWTNVFDWLGGDGAYRWHPVDGQQKPGIEKESDGSARAYNAIDVNFPPVFPNDWAKLRSLDRGSAVGLDLTPYVCLIALVLMVAAIAITRSPLGRG